MQLCSLKGQRLKIQTELGNMVTTEELFLQCITGNETPTQPHTLPFVSETHFLLGVLYFPWPSLLPWHHPGTASILALLSAKIGGGNGLGTKTSDMSSGYLWEQDLLECYAQAHYSCVGVTGRIFLLALPTLFGFAF